MSAAVYTVVTTIVAFYIWLAVCLYRREQRRPLKRDQIIASAREIDELELLYSLPAYDEAATAINDGLTQLFEELGPPPSPDPMEAGRDRLRDAIRNDQTEEGQ
ncbi:hypothetical protein AB0C88_37840 [Streptomyces chartreusis]|uniref:hypothetical protein n=1 Tax=Streptomyces chartreusis TaxID=1969 RepID=UPI0033F4C27E